MKKVIIIDDEPLARSIVKTYLDDFPELEIVAECGDGFEGVKMIAQHQPDLVFLDIQMPKINGFEMLELIQEKPDIIFTTAFDEYALKAFETHALDYLLKPFSKERFAGAIEKWRKAEKPKAETIAGITETANKQPDERFRIVVKDGTEIRIIPTADIHYLEAYDDYVKIFMKNGYHLKKKTMNYFEKVLDPKQFIRIHRSYIININELTRIESFEKNSYVAILRSEKRVPISRSSYSELKSILGL